MAAPLRGPLRLRSLRIKDFRSIDQLDLDFVDLAGQPLDTIVFAGDNGCGKTSLLEAGLLMLGQRKLLPDDAAPLEEQVRFGSSSFQITGEVAVTDSSGIGSVESLDASDIAQLNWPRIQAASWGGGIGELPNGVFWKKIEKLSPQVEYFSARREPESLGETPQSRGARSMREARRIVELKRRMRNAFNRAARLTREGQVSPTIPVIDRIQKMWNYLYGDSEVLDIIALSNDEGDDDEVVLREPNKPLPSDVTSLAMARKYAPSRSDIPRMVPLDRLSSGQVALFAFAGPLIFRDQPPDVVVIDEPEQHMHAQWQRLLVSLLRVLAPTAQFILATHSEEILRSVPSHQRFLLVRDDDPRARVAARGDIKE